MENQADHNALLREGLDLVVMKGKEEKMQLFTTPWKREQEQECREMWLVPVWRTLPSPPPGTYNTSSTAVQAPGGGGEGLAIRMLAITGWSAAIAKYQRLEEI